MTTTAAYRHVLNSLIITTRGLRLARSPQIAEVAAKREQELLQELADLPTDATEMPLFPDDDEEPLAVGFAHQPKKEGK